MADKPILFSGPMIRALLDGRKTMTRRVLKPQPKEYRNEYCRRLQFFNRTGRMMADVSPEGPFDLWLHTPYAPGDRLWVREAWADDAEAAWEPQRRGTYYRADPDAEDIAAGNRSCGIPHDWRPSIHMPCWRSRLTLIVTDVRVQQVQEISESDAWLEGIDQRPDTSCRNDFRDLWDFINAKRPGCLWADNPWVCAISFNVIHKNIDEVERDFQTTGGFP